MIGAGRAEQAYLLWTQSLPPERLSKLGYLYNAGFEYPVSNLPFDWVFAKVDSAIVELSAETDTPVLQLGFFGGRVSKPLVSHLLTLPPGTYRFTGREHSDALMNERGLRWRIFCLERPDESITRRRHLSATRPGVDST